MKEFHSNAKLPKVITTSFLILIPKMKNPQSLNEFRPIFLVGFLFKIMAKILTSIHKRVLGKVVSKNQSAFAPGRHIFDGVLVVNEAMDLAKRGRRDYMVMKVDFERVYDGMSWILYPLCLCDSYGGAHRFDEEGSGNRVI